MGKKSSKFRKHNHGEKGSKKSKNEWKCQAIPDEHPLFREYYQKQLGLEEEDFKQFWLSMKEKLPVVFRVNANYPNYRAFCAKLEDENFLTNLLSSSEAAEAVEQPKVESQAEQPVADPQGEFEPK